MNNEEEDYFELDEIILTLEAIRDYGKGDFNFPLAILSLAKEIKSIKDRLFKHDID